MPSDTRRPPTVTDAAFIAEARSVGALPPLGAPEVAIAGRSNVGKSTLLNRLAGRRGLARTSKTPGRTRGIVFFELALAGSGPRAIRLVDLPGYGYAQVSRSEREAWRPLIEGYARAREPLVLFIILIDARRGVEDEERQLYQWVGALGVPVQVVFTKVDKLSASERGALKARVSELFKGAPKRPLPAPAASNESPEGAAARRRVAPLFVSAQTGEGIDALWAAILDAAAAAAPDGVAGPEAPA